MSLAGNLVILDFIILVVMITYELLIYVVKRDIVELLENLYK